MTASTARPSIDERIERIPLLPWHWRTLGIVGIAQGAELIDSVALSFALPVLMQKWSLTSIEGGLLISATYGGQMVGGALVGWISDRYGRVNLLRWSTAAVVLLGLLLAWSTSYHWFLALRFVQGIGMGGVLVLAVTYIAEMAGSSFRGRLMFGLNIIIAFATSISAIVAAAIIPAWGVQWIFYIGAIISVPFFIIGRILPESPRWLALQGRDAEADAIVSGIEASAMQRKHPQAAPTIIESPADAAAADGPGGWRGLLSPGLAPTTLCLWLMAISTGAVGITLIAWMPTIFLRSYDISVSSTLLFSSISYMAPIVAALGGIAIIDRFAHDRCLSLGFSSLILLLLGMLFAFGNVAIGVAVIVSFFTVLAFMFSIQTFYLVSAEKYPTSLRGAGTGAVRFWGAMSAIIVPLCIGWIMDELGFRGVLVFVVAAALVGLLAAFSLERVSRRRMATT